MKNTFRIIFIFAVFMCHLSAQNQQSDLYVCHALGRIVVVSGEISEEANAQLIDIQYGIQQQRLGVVNIAIDEVVLSFLDSNMAGFFLHI